MEPITHALASVALARAAGSRATPLAMPMAVVAGLAAEVDFVSLAGGAATYLEYNRTAAHSLLGSALLAAGVGAGFWVAGRHRKRAVRLRPALGVSFAAAALHLLLDLGNSYGVQLLWPLRRGWWAADLLESVDPWLLILLAAGLALPELFRLVSEEIGARPSARAAQGWALATLALAGVYAGARWVLHEQAVALLNARMYHGAVAERVGAFPAGASPLAWRGVVSTENTLEEVAVPLGPAGSFESGRSRTYFKPELSPPLEAAQATEAVERFVRFARFPIASVERLEQGYRVTVRDLRFPQGKEATRVPTAVVALDDAARITQAAIRFTAEER